MRWLFLLGVFVLLQGLSYLAGLGLAWVLRPYVAKSLLVWGRVLVFLVGNLLFLTALLQWVNFGYRLLAAWLILLLFVGFSALATTVLGIFLQKFAPNLGGFEVLGIRLFAVGMVLGLFAWSAWNAYTPTVRHLRLEIDKPLAKPIRVAMASDLHLGALFGAKSLDRLAQIVQQEKADILLIAGDVFDDDTVAFYQENMAPSLQKVAQSAPSGTFATLGNHDVYRDQTKISQAIENSGIILLKDEAKAINWGDGKIWLVGRFDDHIGNRLPTEQILNTTDPKQPIFLLDHRPTQIETHSQLPIDLQVSGHTHNGQIFPANFIVQAINRLGYGYEKIGNGHFVVSSGYGFWGIPLRLGSQSEVWILDIVSKTNNPN